MILTIIGGCLIGGGMKGIIDRMLKPNRRPLKERTPVYSSVKHTPASSK